MGGLTGGIVGRKRLIRVGFFNNKGVIRGLGGWVADL